MYYLCIVKQIKRMNMEYTTEDFGYNVRETLEGLEVSEDGKVVCTLEGKSLTGYMNDENVIDSETLEDDIREQIEIEGFLSYQKEYC